jgi:hypothetical protein
MCPSLTGAQDGFDVGGAVMVAVQGGHRQGSSPSLPTTGAEGVAPGAVIEFGGEVSRTVDVGVEVSLPRRFTTLQRTNYTRSFEQESRHRDAVVSGLIRWTPGAPDRVRVGIVGGGGIVQENTRQRLREQVRPFPATPADFGPFSEEYGFTRWTWNVMAGADVAFALSSAVAVVPQMRVHWARRSQDTSQQGWALGLDAVMLRPAVGVRVSF